LVDLLLALFFHVEKLPPFRFSPRIFSCSQVICDLLQRHQIRLHKTRDQHRDRAGTHGDDRATRGDTL